MNFLQQNLIDIFNSYQAPQPLSVFLKEYFSANKKLGSRDRKAIREAVYSYYRWCAFVSDEGEHLNLVKWCIDNGHLSHPYLVKMLEDIPSVNLSDKPFLTPPLSSEWSAESYKAFLMQLPALFIRITKSREFDVIRNLKVHVENVRLVDNYGCDFTILKLPNSCPVQTILKDNEYAVQDYASQLSIIRASKLINSNIRKVWDVCSGAGGKTILLSQVFKPESVYSFDIRPQILQNLRKRVDMYGLKFIKTIVHDWSQKAYDASSSEEADLIVCDVPCSGSGTWGRTPENISALSSEGINDMALLQSKIMKHVMENASPDAYILYITCSVFYHENEFQIEKLVEDYGINIIQQEMIIGTKLESDSMYYCLFKKGK